MDANQRKQFGETIKQILINQINAIEVVEGTNKQDIYEAIRGSLEVFLVEREEAGLPVRPHPDFRVIETGSTYGRG
jgi:citrate lyase gamma subunit